MLRVSQALARLRFADEVITDDVDEALRLIEVSKASLYEDSRDRRGDQSPSTKIYNLICGMRDSGAAATGEGSGELDMRRVRERVLAKGFTVQQLEACLDEYATIDVSCGLMRLHQGREADTLNQIWQTAAEGTRLVFIDSGDGDADMGDEDF